MSEWVAQTPRLGFRRFSAEDAAGFFHLNNDPEVLQYTGDEPFADEKAARNFLRGYDHYEAYGYGRWSVYLKDTAEYVGFCGLKYTPTANEVDVGFRIGRRHWNKGIATEAAREALRLGFEHYGLKKIVGRAMQANKASHRVLEKLGMNLVGTFEEAGVVWLQYEINDADARSRHGFAVPTIR